MLESLRNILNAWKSAPRGAVLGGAIITVVTVAGYIAYKFLIEHRLSSDFISAAKLWLAVVALAIAAISGLVGMFRRGSVWEPGDLSPSGLPNLQTPDVIVGVVAALGCVAWFLVRDVPMLNIVLPLCLLIGGQVYLGYRDTFVKPPRKGPRRSPLEQLQEWDDDGRF